MLRDAWEGMLVRDIAMAGGVDPRQVKSRAYLKEMHKRWRLLTVPSAGHGFQDLVNWAAAN